MKKYYSMEEKALIKICLVDADAIVTYPNNFNMKGLLHYRRNRCNML